MKIKLLFLIACLWFVNGFTQSYRPFPESNAYWIEKHDRLQLGACSFDYHMCTDPVYFGSDTTINSIVYHTLLYHQVCSVQYAGIPPPPPPCQWLWYYNVPLATFAFIRQDSIARKVFIYDTASNQDTLLYDFNLSVGNPLPHTYNNPMYPNVIVTSIDSLLLPDGYHRRYNLNVPAFSDSASLIEGIGSTFGLTAALVEPFENFDQLICFSHNNVTIYPNSSASCDFTVGVPEEKNEEMLGIYPNPSEDFIQIRNPFASPFLVTVLSSYGSLVHQTIIAKEADAMIDLSAWANGIYVVTAVSDKNCVSKKIIKQ